MQKLRTLGAVAAVCAAIVLTVITSAAAHTTPPPAAIEYCHLWPGKTSVHWDNQLLGSPVTKVKFFWEALFMQLGDGTVRGNENFEQTTPLTAQDVLAVLTLGNGGQVKTGVAICA